MARLPLEACIEQISILLDGRGDIHYFAPLARFSTLSRAAAGFRPSAGDQRAV